MKSSLFLFLLPLNFQIKLSKQITEEKKSHAYKQQNKGKWKIPTSNPEQNDQQRAIWLQRPDKPNQTVFSASACNFVRREVGRKTRRSKLWIMRWSLFESDLCVVCLWWRSEMAEQRRKRVLTRSKMDGVVVCHAAVDLARFPTTNPVCSFFFSFFCATGLLSFWILHVCIWCCFVYGDRK